MRYLQRVAEGAFKETFHVVDADAKPRALKVYKAVGSDRRDQREIEAMLRCDHPSVARLLSVETYGRGTTKFVAITEEFLSGGTLASRAPVTAATCLQIGDALISALAHIACLKLVHRDIKPDNIMFRSDGLTPVITDFGVVRDLTDSSATPTWAPRGPGTPFFAAPEQLNNEKSLIDWRTDQFALGVSLSFVTIGDHPYRTRGLSDRGVVDRVASRQPPAPWFEKAATPIGLTALLPMVAAWPVNRYRKPETLRKAWLAQKGKSA